MCIVIWYFILYLQLCFYRNISGPCAFHDVIKSDCLQRKSQRTIAPKLILHWIKYGTRSLCYCVRDEQRLVTHTHLSTTGASGLGCFRQFSFWSQEVEEIFRTSLVGFGSFFLFSRETRFSNFFQILDNLFSIPQCSCTSIKLVRSIELQSTIKDTISSKTVLFFKWGCSDYAWLSDLKIAL